MTAREAAKDLVRVCVLRGDTIKQLSDGMMGFCSDAYHACIGGYIFNNLGKENETSRKVGKYQIGVEKVGSAECMQVFSLQEIYDEILYERDNGKQELIPLF